MFAYDNDGSSGHGWRLDLKICEVFALTARALCGSISLQIEIDSHNTSKSCLLSLVMLRMGTRLLLYCCSGRRVRSALSLLLETNFCFILTLIFATQPKDLCKCIT